MKTGVIVYVVGRETHDEDFDAVAAIKGLDINADRVEVVSSRSGHFDVMDAWWSLTAKGINNVVCMIAEIVNGSGLRLTGREMRLCG